MFDRQEKRRHFDDKTKANLTSSKLSRNQNSARFQVSLFLVSEFFKFPAKRSVIVV